MQQVLNILHKDENPKTEPVFVLTSLEKQRFRDSVSVECIKQARKAKERIRDKRLKEI